MSKIVMSDPPDAAQQLQNALLFHGSGNLGQAESAYKKILELHPKNADALHYLGVIGLQTGRLEFAVEHIQRALQIQPENADALINLGNAQHAMGHLDEALLTFERAMALQGESATLLSNIGNVYMQQGQRADAIACFIRALEKEPTLAEARRNLANTLLDAGKSVEALRHISLAAKADEHSLPVCVSLGNILHANGMYQDAISTFQRALEKRPDHPPLMCGLARVLDDAGQTHAAIALLEKAIQIDPEFAEGYYALGIAQLHFGDKQDAEISLRRGLTIDEYCTKALLAIASLSKSTPDDTTLTDITRTLALPDLTSEQREQLEFAAGKCNEDLGNYDAAGRHILTANKLHRSKYDYDVGGDQRAMRNIEQTFNREAILRHSNVGVADATPIFILGMPRSGTSLVEQILASHSKVVGGGELLHLPREIAGRMHLSRGIDMTASLETASDTDFTHIAREYLTQQRTIDSDAQHITDKLPHNFLHVGLIRILFPAAKIIHCVRDAADCCWSIYKNFLGSRGHDYAYQLDELGHYYCAYERLMEHWHSVLPGMIHDVRYEDLINNQAQTTRELLHACDLRWEAACLEFHKARRDVRTISASQVRQPLYSSSVKSWKPVEELLQPMLNILAKG